MTQIGVQRDTTLVAGNRSQRRDTLVIGTSAGGLRELRTLIAQLPSDFPGLVFVVQHQSPSAQSKLADILQQDTSLHVQLVDQQTTAAPGNIYVAPPDRHLIVAGDEVMLSAGARENRSRPSINVLFRTAAATRGSRTIGTLLTGTLDDGVAGLDAIRRCGGVTIVQDPTDAEFPELPSRAMRAGRIDHVLPLGQLGELVTKLSREVAPRTPIPEDIFVEAHFALPAGSTASSVASLGAHTLVACPSCGGPLWQVGEQPVAIYRCSIGHALSAPALLEEQAAEIERALWVAVRSLEERASLLDSIAAGAEARGYAAERERTAATEALDQAESVREFLVRLRAKELPGREDD